jgi:Helitron helicase-like domain at N-terminus
MCVLLQRRDPLSSLFQSGRLLHAFVLDAGVRSEDMNLQYIKKNLQTVLTMPYADLMQHFEDQARLHRVPPGRTFILPASYSRSQRCMDQRLRNCMQAVRSLGLLDMMITVTGNPYWDELVNNRRFFPPNDSHNIDATNRLLHLKMKQLLTMIVDLYLFGVSTGTIFP